MRVPTRFPIVPTLATFLILLAGGARGQGILYPRPEIREQPFAVKSVRVNATINDGVAETTVEQTFINLSSVEQEGTYLFPLPEGATVTSFTLQAGDRVLEGRVLSKDEARGVYESIVRRRRDPALLEYVGRGVFRASVFPIPPQGERTLTLRYAEVLKPEGALMKFSYPLSTGRFSIRPLAVASINVRLKTTSPLKTIYSPTHDVSIRRQDDTSATASWESRAEFPDRDFLLYYATNADNVGLSLLTYQTGDRDGYFMLIAAPRFSVPKARILPKQIVFVLDRTGSMQANHKMDQAKAALQFCLDNLNPNDRFDVITFNEQPDTLERSLLPATRDNIDKAQRFVRNIEASGGTNIDEALRAGLSLLKNAEGTQKMIVFLTDGLPTVGETNVETILANVRRINGGSRLASTKITDAQEAAGVHARIFSFGVGYDVNVPFLDRLAEETHAEADYVRPEESVESIVSSFFAKVTSPVLANVRLAFDGVEAYDLYPKELPDLFKGGQLVVTGRYRGEGPGAVKLIGFTQGDEASYRLDRAFGERAARSSLVPRIWATRKIGYLLDQVRLHQNQEVIDEIVRLSKEYGILTPYTSYLADERQDGAVHANAALPGSQSIITYDVDNAIIQRGLDDSKRELKEIIRLKDQSGQAETYRSLNSKGYQQANRAPTATQGYFYGGGVGGGGFGGPGGALGGVSAGRGARSGLGLDFGKADFGMRPLASSNEPGYKQVERAARVQSVAGRTFYKRGEVWFDIGYPSGRKVIKIKALSDAHFAILRALPQLNKYAAIGDEVLINLSKVAVQFGKEGKETLTEAELSEITGK